MKYADFGSISHGTMQPEDLIPCFASELDSLLAKQSKRLPRGEYRALIRAVNKLTDFDTANADDILETLFNALEEFAPPYAYFGAHEGNSSNYGFWLSDDAIQLSFDGLKVDDLADVPKGYRGEVLHVNDHGNMSLYYCNSRGKFREIWSIV